MKEATGEGSMTIVTIIVVAALVLAAAVVIGVMMNKANSKANDDIGYDPNDPLQQKIENGINTNTNTNP